MSNYQTIELNSCSVFWKDLGVDIDNNIIREKSSKKWDEIEFWLSENVDSQNWRAYNKGIWFLRKRDAVLFKLIWSGQIV